jgi:hypothetical protein
LAALAWALYRPKVQGSATYKTMVVPLANIMDVGFIVLSPIIVVLVGYDAPLFMLAICLLAILTGFAISYNIRHYEPLIGTPDPINRLNTLATWALIAASVVNIAYYAQLLTSLVLLPIGDLYSPDRASVTGAVVLGALALVGFFYGLRALNAVGDKTTSFNLAALGAVLVAFAAYNLQQLIGGDFSIPDYNPPNDTESLRKLLGFFAMVQGFEAARYLGARAGVELRISTMRLAQYISTAVFVLLIALSLVLFVKVSPPADATAIFEISEEVSVFLPFLILLAALGSQLSAIVNATYSRSEMLMEQTQGKIRQAVTFPLLLVPAIAVVLLTDVTSVVALASRVFAAYFLVQAVIAGWLAVRRREWAWVAFFVAIGIAMAVIAVFGIPA